MKRKCSCCHADGHNSRTCPRRKGGEIDGGGGGSGGGVGDDGGFKLFGVRLTDGSYMKKSFSMGNLAHYHSSYSAAANSPDGYHSDDPGHGGSASDALPRAQRRKGVPWTEEEHRQFLHGLQRFGKGEWRHISRNFVPSKTPSQVASHAQKFYNRRCNPATRGKRRSSLFDMVLNTATNSAPIPAQFNISPPAVGTENAPLARSSSQEAETNHSASSLHLSLKPAFLPFTTSTVAAKFSSS